MNAWVLIFSFKSLETIFPSFLISKIFWGHAPIPPWRTRGRRPLLSAPAGANKRETPTSNLTESTDDSTNVSLFQFYCSNSTVCCRLLTWYGYYNGYCWITGRTKNCVDGSYQLYNDANVFFFVGCKRDDNGYYWITGRTDDCMNVSGHLLSTAQIESALVEHEAVTEAAVVS